MSSRRFWIGAIITDPNSSLVHPLRILQTVSMEKARLIPPSRRDDGDRVSLFRMDPFLRPLQPLSAVVLPLTISWRRANEEEEPTCRSLNTLRTGTISSTSVPYAYMLLMEKELSSGQTTLNSRPWDTSRTNTSVGS